MLFFYTSVFVGKKGTYTQELVLSYEQKMEKLIRFWESMILLQSEPWSNFFTSTSIASPCSKTDSAATPIWRMQMPSYTMSKDLQQVTAEKDSHALMIRINLSNNVIQVSMYIIKKLMPSNITLRKITILSTACYKRECCV